MTDAIPGDDWTLLDARNWLRDRVEDGASCPCCTQFAKVYYRKINSGMVRALALMWRDRHNSLGYVHVSTLRSHEVAQLSWWGLAEEERIARPDGGRAGWWRCTDLGADWLHNRLSVATYARIYDGRLLGLTGGPFLVGEAVKNKFDLQELMEGP